MSSSPGKNRAGARAAQTGLLMKTYRRSFLREDGGSGISQSELLRRMADADPRYGRISSHGTVSRWESGETAPTVERLKTFGQAMDLPAAETESLILLAGLAPLHQEDRTLACPLCGEETVVTGIRTARGKAGAGAAAAAVTKNRKCTGCGHTGESWEQWTDNLREALGRIEEANNQIRQALRDRRNLPPATEIIKRGNAAA